MYSNLSVKIAHKQASRMWLTLRNCTRPVKTYIKFETSVYAKGTDIIIIVHPELKLYFKAIALNE